MYAIYGNIYHQYTPNVSIYTIHGSYGLDDPSRDRNWLVTIDLGKFHHDRTLFSRTLEPWFIVGEIIPKWAARFRLVKYYNLPR